MNGLSEGIGSVIEGGLLGRAVEPRHGESTGTAHQTIPCANCGTTYSGHYCYECGQKAHIHRSLAAIGHDIMHGVLHLDGKLWNTLPLLAFKPGELTRRYIAGERAKFVSPMAMFLFTVFAMFAVFQMVGISAPIDFGEGFIAGADDSAAFQTNIEEQITTLEEQRDDLSNADPRREAINAELEVLGRMLTSNAAADKDDVTTTGIAFLDEGIIAKWKKNPSLMLYKLQANGYKFSWLLIPLHVPFLWLMFAWKRQFKAYDHAVFVTYSLAFNSLLFIAALLVSMFPDGWGWAVLLFFIGSPLHLYKQLRYAYGLRRISALWRFLVLSFIVQFVVVMLFLQVLLVLGAF